MRLSPPPQNRFKRRFFFSDKPPPKHIPHPRAVVGVSPWYQRFTVGIAQGAGAGEQRGGVFTDTVRAAGIHQRQREWGDQRRPTGDHFDKYPERGGPTDAPCPTSSMNRLGRSSPASPFMTASKVSCSRARVQATYSRFPLLTDQLPDRIAYSHLRPGRVGPRVLGRRAAIRAIAGSATSPPPGPPPTRETTAGPWLDAPS
jgi:hypothetical protein